MKLLYQTHSPYARKVLGQSKPFQFPFPILSGSVEVRNITVQRLCELPRYSVHVLRSWPREFINPAEMRHRIGEDRSHYASHINRGNGRGLAGSEWQFNSTSVADAISRER